MEGRFVVAVTVLIATNACSDPPSTLVDSSTDALSTDAADGMRAQPDDGAPPPPDVTVPPDAAVDSAPPGDAISATTYCSLGQDVPGAIVPAGFCLRRYAGPANTSQPANSPVAEPRTLSFAPNGDLFVGAPASPGAGGGTGGPGAILVLSDDNLDGTAEVQTFLSGVSDVHGVAVGTNEIYFTSSGGVMQVAYQAGQRAATTSPAPFAPIPAAGRITHGLARTAGGVLYFSTGADSFACGDSQVGFIDHIDSSGNVTTAAIGFRNPMYLRCHYRDEVCTATELGDDGGVSWGAHEKLLVIHPASNYGYPCCSTTNQPTPENTGMMSCASVTTEEATFTLNDTPFGMDWEHGVWPSPYTNVLCVGKHGSFYSNPAWQGVGVFCAPTDPTTHAPNGAFQIFVDGFGPGGGPLERAADVAFSPDGRMFVSDDIGNAIYWIAPTTLALPGH